MHDDFTRDVEEARKELRKRKEKTESKLFEDYKGLTFPQFWSVIGKDLEYFDYEENLTNLLVDHKYIWIKKATGLGMTEFILRWIAWNCVKNDEYKLNQLDASVVIITGPNMELSQKLIFRLKELFDINFTDKSTVCYLNGARIEAFPSHHLAAARGLNPNIVFLDEADFFPIGQQEEARSISERYIAKTNPHIIMVSTPNNPGGLFEQMEREEPSMYERLKLDYTIGIGKIYDNDQLEIAKKSPTFEREYNLRYGYGIGDIFPYEFVNRCTMEYDLTLGSGEKVLAVDPAYGSSKFAILGVEKNEGIMWIKEAQQFARPSPAVMTDLIVLKAKDYKRVIVDSAHPGLIRDLVDRGVNATPVVFGEKIDPKNTLLSKMTIEASQAVRELRVRIHPIFKDLISQLMAVKFNEKGHPDKTELTFDLGDTLLMATNFLKNSRVTIIKV